MKTWTLTLEAGESVNTRELHVLSVDHFIRLYGRKRREITIIVFEADHDCSDFATEV